MSNMTIDKYSIGRAWLRGDFSEYWAGFAPPSIEIPANFGISLGKLIEYSMNGETDKIPQARRDAIRNAGGIGRMVDWWFLGGAEEDNAKLRAQREQALSKRLGF